MILSPSLKSLTLKSGFHNNILQNPLPLLHFLYLDLRISQLPSSLPPSLTHLHLHYKCSSPIYSLPNTLKYLDLGEIFPSVNKLPKRLIHIGYRGQLTPQDSLKIPPYCHLSPLSFTVCYSCSEHISLCKDDNDWIEGLFVNWL